MLRMILQASFTVLLLLAVQIFDRILGEGLSPIIRAVIEWFVVLLIAWGSWWFDRLGVEPGPPSR